MSKLELELKFSLCEASSGNAALFATISTYYLSMYQQADIPQLENSQ